ncbi:uncharacterized protein LOC134813793 [Bolinopsis microptera]|uniref:uncharacterized protein LOC134813793 n=1 Tax=Bolinopsis microptera TaxID=2820187 RepID=UPI00307A46D9
MRCTTGECIDLRKLCDGKCDCLDENVCEDETLLCSDSPFQQQFLLVSEQAEAALEKAVEKLKKALQSEILEEAEAASEKKRESQVSSSADNFEIALSFVLFITYGLCYILD